MMTSIYSRHEYRSEDGSSKLTAHAAVQFRQRHNSISNGATAGQLLEEVNIEDSVQLKRLVHKTFPACNVNLVHAVNSPQMYGIYLLRKEEMRLTHGEYCDKELILYHVTTKARALESLKSGLDWRRTRRSKFGCGVSFSDDADYANYYADQFLREGNADTTVSPSGRVYVKYDNYDFYPLYLIYYQQAQEHLNESKYFRNNPINERQQNNQVIQQQRQELQAQRDHKQVQREQKQVQREQKQAQSERKEAQYELKQAQRELRQAQSERKQAQRELKQSQCEQKQAQGERKQAQRELQQAQRELRQAQYERKQAQREQKQAQCKRKQAQCKRKQAQRMQEQGQLVREQAQRMREHLQKASTTHARAGTALPRSDTAHATASN